VSGKKNGELPGKGFVFRDDFRFTELCLSVNCSGARPWAEASGRRSARSEEGTTESILCTEPRTGPLFCDGMERKDIDLYLIFKEILSYLLLVGLI
jgi:hypothetical protein